MPPAPARPPLSAGRFWALFAALAGLAGAPLLAAGVLPLVDYPNHLARMLVLAAPPRLAPLAQFYAIDWRPIPDLAMDALVPPLLAFMPAAWAGKLFVFAAFLLLAGGAAAINRVLLGRWSPWPCLAFLLLYGRLLLWGQLNFLFGLGLALVAFAAWLALARRGAGVRLAAGILFALGLYFAHLMALGIYAVLAVGHAAGPLWQRPRGKDRIARLAVAALPFAVPAALLLLSGAGAGGAIAFAKPWRKLDLLFSVFDLYHRPFDAACFALVVLGLGFAYWRRWLKLAPGMAAPLALLALAYLVMPSQALTASGIDRRMPLALGLVLVAASTWVAPRPRLERAYLGAAAALFVVRLATVWASWQASDAQYRAILAAFAAVPPGATVAIAYPPDAVNVTATPLIHLPVLAATARAAFAPTLFAAPGQQPVRLRPPWAEIAVRLAPGRLWAALVGPGTPLDPGEAALLARFDFVAFAANRPFAMTPAPGLEPVLVTPRFRLYRRAG